MAGAAVQPPLFGAAADARGFAWGWAVVAANMALAAALCYRAAGRRSPGPC